MFNTKYIFMKENDYLKLKTLKIPNKILDLVSNIYIRNNKEKSIRKKFVFYYRTMKANTISDSIIYSNFSDNKYIDIHRMKRLIKKITKPRNRVEEELEAYMNALEYLNENYENLEFNKETINIVYNKLRFDMPKDELILDTNFNHKTEMKIENIISKYNKGIEEGIEPLLLIPLVILDIFNIKSFKNLNFKMATLLTRILLFKLGINIYIYFSIEKIIIESGIKYYINQDIEYKQKNVIETFLENIYKAYLECDNRYKFMTRVNLKPENDIIKTLRESKTPLSRREIMSLCPDISNKVMENRLKKLKSNNIIIQLGMGCKVKYIINKDR